MTPGNTDRWVGPRLSRLLMPPAHTAVPVATRLQPWRGRIFIHRRAWGERPQLPPTGSSGLPWRWRFRPQVHAGRVRHPDGQTDRRPRRRGRAVGTPARTIRMPPVSRSGSRAADGHQSRIIQRARTRQARARECRGGTGCRSPGRQGAGRCGRPDRPSSYSGITLSDEGGLKGTHATRRSDWNGPFGPTR